MAKKVNPIRGATKSKDIVKVIRSVKSPETGAYAFKEEFIHKDDVKMFFQSK